MYLVALAWIYVVLMMAVAEATSSNGTVLGALITAVLYGVMPLSIVMYLLRTPQRRRLRRAREDEEAEALASANGRSQPDEGGHASGDAIAAEGEEAGRVAGSAPAPAAHGRDAQG